LTFALALFLFSQSSIALADGSIWYKNSDPLNTELLAPSAIPEAYLEANTCSVINYSNALWTSPVSVDIS